MSKEAAEKAIEKLEDSVAESGEGNIEVVEGETIKIEPDKEEETEETEETKVATGDDEEVSPDDDDKEVADDDDDDSGDEEEDESEEEAEEEQLPFPDELLEAAVVAGLSLKESKAMTPEALKTMLGILARDRKPEKEEKKDDAPEFVLELDEEVDDTIKGAFTGMKQHYEGLLEKQAKDHKESSERFERTFAAQETVRFDDRFDAAVSGLGKPWEPTFGVDDIDEIDRGSVEYKNRTKLREEVIRQHNSFTNENKRPPKMGKMVERAIAITFSKESKKQGRKKVKNTLKKRASSAVGKPAGKKGKAGTPKERAVAVLTEMEASAEANDE